MELGVNPWCSTHMPWDLGHVGPPLQASVASSVKRERLHPRLGEVGVSNVLAPLC